MSMVWAVRCRELRGLSDQNGAFKFKRECDAAAPHIINRLAAMLLLALITSAAALESKIEIAPGVFMTRLNAGHPDDGKRNETASALAWLPLPAAAASTRRSRTTTSVMSELRFARAACHGRRFS